MSVFDLATFNLRPRCVKSSIIPVKSKYNPYSSYLCINDDAKNSGTRITNNGLKIRWIITEWFASDWANPTIANCSTNEYGGDKESTTFIPGIRCSRSSACTKFTANSNGCSTCTPASRTVIFRTIPACTTTSRLSNTPMDNEPAWTYIWTTFSRK